MCTNLQNILRFPYSSIRNKLMLDTDKFRSNFNLKVIIDFILPLHEQCEECVHLEAFFQKITSG